MQQTNRHTWDEARSAFKQSQRLAIAHAALELLLEGGTAEVTMSMVADRAGISRQTLYRYFPDLNSVLTASVEGIDTADEALRTWVMEGGDASEQLHRFVDAIVDAAAHQSGSAEQLLAALPPDARVAVHAHQDRTVALIRDILRSLSVDPSVDYSGDPEVDAPLLLGLISAATEQSRERTHTFIDQITNGTK